MEDCKEECDHLVHCRALFCGEGKPEHRKCLNECNARNDCKATCFKWTLCRAGDCGEGGPRHTKCLDECKTGFAIFWPHSNLVLDLDSKFWRMCAIGTIISVH